MITAITMPEGTTLTVNRLSDNRVLIILCGKDMEEFSLKYDKMNLDDSHSRKIIIRLMQLACGKSGIETVGKKINIEAISLESNCYLLITVNDKKRRTFRIKQSKKSICYMLGNGSGFLDTIEILYKQNICCNKNSAYVLNGKYYLIFDYPTIPKKLKMTLSEYAQRCSGKIVTAKIRESGTPICTQNAILQIGKYL